MFYNLCLANLESNTFKPLLIHLNTMQLRREDTEVLLNIATYLLNRLHCKPLKNKSPFEALFNQNPNYEKLKTGCTCFPWLEPCNHHKLEKKSTPCIFLGYSKNQSAYICYDLVTNKTYISRHVLFDELNFPFQHNSTSSLDTELNKVSSFVPVKTIINKHLLPAPTSLKRSCPTPSLSPLLVSKQAGPSGDLTSRKEVIS